MNALNQGTNLVKKTMNTKTVEHYIQSLSEKADMIHDQNEKIAIALKILEESGKDPDGDIEDAVSAAHGRSLEKLQAKKNELLKQFVNAVNELPDGDEKDEFQRGFWYTYYLVGLTTSAV